MQLELMPEDFKEKQVLISLSGGIDSMGALCYLASVYPEDLRPSTIYLYYVHLKEHSPRTAEFVVAGICYAKRHFKHVIWEYHNSGSVVDYFEGENFIPHPMFAPCSENLKMVWVNRFKEKHAIEVDIVGYLLHEKRRMAKAIERGAIEQGKYFLACHLLQADVFELVSREIGWYPPIYDIRDEHGKRKFKHNNCLPCKNMGGVLDTNGASGEFAHVVEHYPDNAQRAIELSQKLGAHWGRGEKSTGHCIVCEA